MKNLKQTIGFTWKLMRLNLRNSLKTIGFRMKFMRFSVRSLSKTIGFTLELMKLNLRNCKKHGFYNGIHETQIENPQQNHWSYTIIRGWDWDETISLNCKVIQPQVINYELKGKGRGLPNQRGQAGFINRGGQGPLLGGSNSS